MNGYQIKENIGRKKLQQFLTTKGVTDINFTKGEFDRIDCFFTYKGKTVGVEIKDRSPKYEDYDTYIMEKQKLDYMDSLQTSGNTYSCWMVYFFGNNMYLFKYRDIKKLIKDGVIELENKYLPNSTVYKTKDVCKVTYLLPKKYANKFKIDYNN